VTQAQRAFLIGVFIGIFMTVCAGLAFHVAPQPAQPDGWRFGSQRWDQQALAPDLDAPVCPNGIYDAPGGHLRQC
jgi:hypothetical protein